LLFGAGIVVEMDGTYEDDGSSEDVTEDEAAPFNAAPIQILAQNRGKMSSG
jgi:hypothetical protein